MKNSRIIFLKYLDNAVKWEKEKQKMLLKAQKPFNKAEILDIVEDYELSSIQSTQDCVDRVKMIKVLHNTILRRMFLSVVRENFENINFNNLKQNAAYLKIKNNILLRNPEIGFVDDDKFLKQIGNSFAHGNYNSLFNIERFESLWTGMNQEKVAFNKKNGKFNIVLSDAEVFKSKEDFNYNATLLLNNLKQVFNLPKPVSDLRYMLHYLGSIDDNLELVGFKFESNFMQDENGDIIKRPSPETINLKITHSELDALLVMMFAERSFNLQLSLINKGSNNDEPVQISDGLADDVVASMFLNLNDLVLYNIQDNLVLKIDLDEKQKEFFINEYVKTREWFGRDFFNVKDEMLRDLLSTNQPSHIFKLENFLIQNSLNLSYLDLCVNNIEQLFDIAEYKKIQYLTQNKSDLITAEGEEIAILKSVFDSYTESLTTEFLLLMQIVEDNGLISLLENCDRINKIIQTLNQDEMGKVRLSPKYKNDIRSVLNHLRDSFSHMIYLNNQNESLFIYDYVSKRNKTPDFKFVISIKQLEQLKDEIFQIVQNQTLEQEDEIEQERQNN